MYLQDALRPPPMSPGICLLLLLTFTSCLHAQSLTVDDSSWQYQPVDSLKVDLLLELAKQNRYAAPDSARFFCQQALRISMQKSLLSREMLSLNQLGILSKNARQFAEAVAFYTQGLALARELAIPKRQASFLNNLGNVYHRWNKMDSALQAYQESLEVKKRLGDYRGMAKSFNNLGNFYASREEHNRSKAYFSRSLELVMEYGEEKDQARTSLNLGNAFFKLENYDSAAYCYEQAYEFFAAESYPREAALCLHNLAGIEEKKGRFPTALRLYQQCLQQHIALGDTVSQVNTLQNIGNLYKEQAQYEAAITIFEMALAHAERQQLPDRLRMLNFQLSTCYEEIGQAQLALQHHKQYLVWHDSIYNVRQDALVLEVKTKYETEQRTQHLQLAQAENKLKQERINKLIGFAVLLVVLLGVGARAYLQKRRAHQTLQVQKNLVSRQKQEKALLLRELHHRVTNNLQLISSVLNIQAHQLGASKEGKAVQKSQTRVEAMALLHRDLYQKESQSQINLGAFLTNLVENLKQSYRVPDLVVNQQIAPVDIRADVGIPLGLMLNEIITNAFKYAFSTTSAPQLTLKLSLPDPGSLSIVIQDNGQLSTGQPSAHPSFGHELIDSLAQQIGAKLKLSTAQGYHYHVLLPLSST